MWNDLLVCLFHTMTCVTGLPFRGWLPGAASYPVVTLLVRGPVGSLALHRPGEQRGFTRPQ